MRLIWRLRLDVDKVEWLLCVRQNFPTDLGTWRNWPEWKNWFKNWCFKHRYLNEMVLICQVSLYFTIATLVATSIESTSFPNMKGKWYSGLIGSTSVFWFRAIFARFSGERSSKFFIGWIAILSNTWDKYVRYLLSSEILLFKFYLKISWQRWSTFYLFQMIS